MVSYYIEVSYDNKNYGCYYVESLTVDGAKEKICDKIYKDGIINPWLREVEEKLAYKVIEDSNVHNSHA